MKKYLCLMVVVLVLSTMAGVVVGCSKEQQKVTVIGSCNQLQALSCWNSFWNSQTNHQDLDTITKGDSAYFSCPASGMYNFNISDITAQDMIDDPTIGQMLVSMSPVDGITCECKLQLDESEWEWLQANPQQNCDFEGGELE